MKKDIRQQVYEKYDGHCAYCGCEISLKQMQIDHKFPKRLTNLIDYGNNAVPPEDIEGFDNLMPSCRLCNHYKRAYLFEHYRELMKTLHERIENIYIVKVAIAYGILDLREFDGKFYFEKI